MSNELVAVLMLIAAVCALAHYGAGIKRRRAERRKLETWIRGVDDWRR